MLNFQTKTKEVIICILYFLAIFLISLYGCFLPASFIALIFKFLVSAPDSLPVFLCIIVLAMLSTMMIIAFIIYYAAPFALTLIAVNKKWSRYINAFFDNLLTVIISIIAIFLFAAILNRANGRFAFHVYRQICSYLIPQFIFILMFFFIKKLKIKYFQ